MKTLADEILDWLPGFVAGEPRGATVADICEALVVGQPHVRAAVRTLDTEGRAIFLRYPGAKTHLLVPVGHDLGRGLAACAHCRVVFERAGKSKRLCCTRSCANAWSWTKPGAAEHRKIAIKAARATPEARAAQVERNRQRWADPEQRVRLSEQNRQRWADPAQKARRSASIQAVNGSPEKRAEASAIRKAAWADPDYREKCLATMSESMATTAYRASMGDRMRARWQDPAQREKLLSATRANSAKAAAAARGKPQSEEHRRKRTEATARTKAERPHKQSAEHIAKRVEASRRTREARAK